MWEGAYCGKGVCRNKTTDNSTAAASLFRSAEFVPESQSDQLALFHKIFNDAREELLAAQLNLSSPATSHLSSLVARQQQQSCMASTEEAKLLELRKLLPDWQSVTNSSNKLTEVWQNASIVNWMQQQHRQNQQREQNLLQQQLNSSKFVETTANGLSSSVFGDSVATKFLQSHSQTSQLQLAASLLSSAHGYSSLAKTEQQSDLCLKAVNEQLQSLQRNIIAPKAIHAKPGYLSESVSKPQSRLTLKIPGTSDETPSTMSGIISAQDQYSPAATSEGSSQPIDSKNRKHDHSKVHSAKVPDDETSNKEPQNRKKYPVEKTKKVWKKDANASADLEEIVITQPLLKSILDLEVADRKDLTSTDRSSDASESRNTVLVRCTDIVKPSSTVSVTSNAVRNEPSSSSSKSVDGSGVASATKNDTSKRHEKTVSSEEGVDEAGLPRPEESSLNENNLEVSTAVANSSTNSASSITSGAVSPLHLTPPSSSFSNPSTSPLLESVPNTSRSTFCRAPGLGPVTIPEGHSGTQHPLVCQICGFSCNSKFHYNSHMNTHGDHQCTMCDYTSRTEGRLKKHMRDSHTVEQQIAAGLEVGTSQNNVTPVSLKRSASASHNLANSMTSLLENANLAAAAHCVQNSSPPGTSPNSSPNSLEKCNTGLATDESSPNDSVGSIQREEPSTSGASGERRSSKPKNYKCKQCNQVSTSKEEQWTHARSHIPAEKRLECNRCGFVTEYKHHLEYHLRNHVGSKPFQCKKCAYSCVNKSMLNSHMKSHTNVYQFRCRDCSYATKYCHSLKLHLKKYNHNRAGDINDNNGLDVSGSSFDGDDCELRRLSESYSVNGDEDRSPSPQDNVQQNLTNLSTTTPVVTTSSLNLSQLLLQQQQKQQQSEEMGTVTSNAPLRMNALQSIGTGSVVSPQCQICSYHPSSVDEGLRHQMMHIIAGQNEINGSASIPSTGRSKEPLESKVETKCVEKADHLGRHESNGEDEHPETTTSDGGITSGAPCESDKNPDLTGIEKNSSDELSPTDENGERESRKRKAGLKLNEIAARLQEKKSPDVEEGAQETVFVPGDVKKERPNESSANENVARTVASGLPESIPIATLSNSRFYPSIGQTANNLSIFQQFANMQSQQFEERFRVISALWKFSCGHCKMVFQDLMSYLIHMDCHGYDSPFKFYNREQPFDGLINFDLHFSEAKH